MTPTLLDSSTWQSESPPDRQLAAMLAAMRADELAAALERVTTAVGRELSMVAETRSQGMVARSGQSPLLVLDDSAGDALWAAIRAVDASARLHQSTLKSLSHATAALEFFVGALREAQPLVPLRELWVRVLRWLTGSDSAR